MMRCGKDIFVQLSMTCNDAGIEWLRRELEPHGLRVHRVRFPYDLAPSHLDCTFVPLRPGLVLTNPERPILEETPSSSAPTGGASSTRRSRPTRFGRGRRRAPSGSR